MYVLVEWTNDPDYKPDLQTVDFRFATTLMINCILCIFMCLLAMPVRVIGLDVLLYNGALVAADQMPSSATTIFHYLVLWVFWAFSCYLVT